MLTDGYYNYKMDIWGAGCVFFEMLSLFPLFPGNNEKDQIHKIHNILGTPPHEILERFQHNATNIDFNFPHIAGTGIIQLIPHVSPDCQDLITKLLTYNPDERITARQALSSPYFKELRAQDTKPLQIHRDLGGGSSPTSTGDERSVDSQDMVYHQTKRATKPVAPEYVYRKKLQQGSKKDHFDPTSEYNDPANNVSTEEVENVSSCRQ